MGLRRDNALGGIHFNKQLMPLVLNKVSWADPDPGLATENYGLALVTPEFMLLLCWSIWHQHRKALVNALYLRIGTVQRTVPRMAIYHLWLCVRTYGTSDCHGQSEAFNKLGIAKVFEWKEPEGQTPIGRAPSLT
ncbi:hypothetical protein GQ607_004279 [Colletotrichum asianum]|uniref:Uncharacterized protein n=1 Tax=Colletotrichum asianum TaxID=702518 RepID=A0A8H3WI69_9PEZI|nr:hypothetical protein GQ607_004279 [Colletotrichum asianum]